MIGGLEDLLGVKIPSDFNSEETRFFLLKLCEKHKVDCPEPRTAARLLDKVKFIFNLVNRRIYRTNLYQSYFHH